MGWRGAAIAENASDRFLGSGWPLLREVLLFEPLRRPQQRRVQADPTRDAVGDQLGDGSGGEQPEQVPGAETRTFGELVPGEAVGIFEPQEHPPERGGRKTRVRHGRLLPVECVTRSRAT